jgi:tRNA threonylcarbamoyladenosine biosynthesis protein TsaE
MTILEKLRAGAITASAAETQALAAELAAALPADATLALHGNLGVGKTTFVQGLAHGFRVREPVTSPTFNIYTVYRGANDLTLVHLDAYRLESALQIENLLLEDFLTTPWCLAVEWPEKIADWISPHALHLDLGITAGERHTLHLR